MRDPVSKSKLVVPEEQHLRLLSGAHTHIHAKQITFSKCLGIVYLTQAPPKGCFVSEHLSTEI